MPRCGCITLKGNPCNNPVIHAGEKCHRHKNVQPPPVIINIPENIQRDTPRPKKIALPFVKNNILECQDRNKDFSLVCRKEYFLLMIEALRNSPHADHFPELLSFCSKYS